MPITINGSGTVTGLSVGGLPDGSINNADLAADAVSTSKILNGAVTIAKMGTNEQSQLCKAWVNFNGTANTNLSGTYSQSGTTVTVTATAHGLIAGNTVYSDITSGTAVDGTYTVATVTDANTFTYTAGTSLTTSGNVTLIRNTIRASYNVSSITDNGVGDYTVNFTTAMVDANYAVTFGVSQQVAANELEGGAIYPSGQQSTSVRVRYRKGDTGTNFDASVFTAAIFR